MARTNDEILRDAEEAVRLQDNAFFRRMVDELDRQYIEAWRNCADAAMREKLHGMVCVVEDFRRNIQASVDAGTIVLSQAEKAKKAASAAAEDNPNVL